MNMTPVRSSSCADWQLSAIRALRISLETVLTITNTARPQQDSAPAEETPRLVGRAGGRLFDDAVAIITTDMVPGGARGGRPLLTFASSRLQK